MYVGTYTDANTMTNQGIYISNAGLANTPHTSNHCMLISIRSVGTPFQIFHPDNSGVFYKRWIPSGSSWSAWYKFTGTAV